MSESETGSWLRQSNSLDRERSVARDQKHIIRKLYQIFTWRQGRCGYLSFILYLSKKYLATVHSTVCPFSNWRGKLCICAGFLVTLQTLKNEGKKLLLFGNHGYFTVKIFFELEGKTLHLCNFFVTMLILSNGREHWYIT